MTQKSSKHYFIIVNYNGGTHLIACIHSIITSRNIRPLIIVVDNASRDQSFEDCKSKFPNVTYIYNTHNIGFAAAANIGMRYALERGATTITLCNPDATITPDCAAKLLMSLRTEKASIVSPLIYKKAPPHIWFSGGHIDFRSFRTIHSFTEPKEKNFVQTSFVSGCTMMIDANICRDIGLFDERFFLYYEDADYCLRALEKGYKIGLVPSAYANHHEISELDSEKKIYFLVLSGLLFFEKHTKGIRRIYFHVHYQLRKLKNYFDRKKNKKLATSVHRAYVDYEKSRI